MNSEIDLDAEIERVWQCTWRLRTSELRDVLAGRDRASLEICTWRPQSGELRDALRGCD